MFLRIHPNLVLIAFLGVLPVFVYSQNLISNPGFETYNECPRHLGNLHQDVADWTTPTSGTTDYFHMCSFHMGTPENFNGVQRTVEGEGYAGFYAYAPDDYREYLQVPLRSTLKAGAVYRLSFYVSLAERSDYAIRDFGILFSSEPLEIDTKKNITKAKRFAYAENEYNYFETPADDFLSDTSDWSRIEARFEAEGTERYLILGNFRTNRQTRTTKTGRSSNKGAYYYIDKVALLEQKPELAIAHASSERQKEGFQLDSLQVFRSLLFEFDTYSLSHPGREELQSLYEFLRQDPDLQLQLAGHTDGKGTVDYNRTLSEKRCLAVAKYLENLGIPSGRIQWEGYGSSRPIASNETEVGRSQNRRVEFLIRKTRHLPPDSEK
ncbi:OmpA family protein [Robiginitalea aurantiaca]|uniref:OmpA family protein n=1 Tax=Robiginitalea aurantiaca TaxID=3056915 RepID=A0ABT7WDH7_9FLAO|nr:OmpA family protein [Robiginitalea aurantiaca]MDM9630975.1 OmpA family protein [Robiginitalea aurantiaca]